MVDDCYLRQLVNHWIITPARNITDMGNVWRQEDQPVKMTTETTVMGLTTAAMTKAAKTIATVSSNNTNDNNNNVGDAAIGRIEC